MVMRMRSKSPAPRMVKSPSRPSEQQCATPPSAQPSGSQPSTSSPARSEEETATQQPNLSVAPTMVIDGISLHDAVRVSELKNFLFRRRHCAAVYSVVEDMPDVMKTWLRSDWKKRPASHIPTDCETHAHKRRRV